MAFCIWECVHCSGFLRRNSNLASLFIDFPEFPIWTCNVRKGVRGECGVAPLVRPVWLLFAIEFSLFQDSIWVVHCWGFLRGGRISGSPLNCFTQVTWEKRMIEQTFSASKAAGTFFVQNWLGSVYFHAFQWAKKDILLILAPRIINVLKGGPKRIWY